MNKEDQTVNESREAMEILYSMSQILNTGLDREALAIVVNLVELGANPEALAATVKELRKESTSMKQ